jgi:hypothetical protein
LGEYIQHYNTHRPHRSLEQRPPEQPPTPPPTTPPVRCQRRDRLGGLIHEYRQAA